MIRPNRFALLTMCVTLTSLSVAGQSQAKAGASKATVSTSGKKTNPQDSARDLSGVWMMQGSRFYIVPEQLPPFQPGGEARFNAKHGPEDDPSGLKCLPFGMPRQIFAPYPMQVIQTPGQLAILYEFEHMFRVIPTGPGTAPEAHPKDLDATYLGHSTAAWDGDTLVIDTRALKADSWMDRGGHMHSDALHLVERYRRVDAETLAMEVTIDDPKIFTVPWIVKRNFALQKGAKLGEYVCEDQN
jgi:hypothetical protein